mmetsp:Transcript_5117/g.12882  ORF Transcript_5117/g.12882 Transcript_5117/m.12882 type:complete len:362 (-) Transcript_5117:106-1191(-)|eukprot:jgi/Tetstr1/440014/TSEL_028375.t1
MRAPGLRTISVAAVAAASASCGMGGAAPSAACENETQREYGRNAYAGFAKDAEYRDRMWDAFFSDGVQAAQELRQRRRERAATEEADAAAARLSVSCDELLAAARTGLKLKRALRLMELTGQEDMILTCKDRSGRTAVMLAAMQGSADNVDLCLKKHPAPRDAVREGDVHGVTPLELACWKGHYLVVDYLLQEGARPNTYDCFGIAPIHKAVGHGQRRVVLRLLQDGSCNVNLQCATPTAPPHYEAITTHQTALHIACRRYNQGFHMPGDRGMAELLLSWGANPCITDIWGNTPLHYAAQAADIDMVRLLLKRGADPELQNNEGKYAMDFLPEWIFDEAWGPALYDLVRVEVPLEDTVEAG